MKWERYTSLTQLYVGTKVKLSEDDEEEWLIEKKYFKPHRDKRNGVTYYRTCFWIRHTEMPQFSRAIHHTQITMVQRNKIYFSNEKMTVLEKSFQANKT